MDLPFNRTQFKVKGVMAGHINTTIKHYGSVALFFSHSTKDLSKLSAAVLELSSAYFFI